MWEGPLYPDILGVVDWKVSNKVKESEIGDSKSDKTPSDNIEQKQHAREHTHFRARLDVPEPARELTVSSSLIVSCVVRVDGTPGARMSRRAALGTH